MSTKIMLMRNVLLRTKFYKPCVPVTIGPQVYHIFKQDVSTKQVYSLPKEPGLVERVLTKVAAVSVRKAQLNSVGYILYESIVDKLDYPYYFRQLNLTDSFYSWFVITELHIWMLMVRLMAEDEECRTVRNRTIAALWSDVNHRSKKLMQGSSSKSRKQVYELSEQLQAAIVSYDEGLNTSDSILAAALWRRIYQQGDVHPENLDILVKYIRKQLRALDDINKDILFTKQDYLWVPLPTKMR